MGAGMTPCAIKDNPSTAARKPDGHTDLSEFGSIKDIGL